MSDRTIDLVTITPGLMVWDYDLRPRRVGEVAFTHAGVNWYQMFDPITGARGSDMDAKRMWRRHPSTYRLPPGSLTRD